MTYLEHIRAMNDGQLAYFLSGIQPEIELFALEMSRALSDNIYGNGKNYTGPDKLFGLNGDARSLLYIMYKDYDLEMKRIEDCYNPGHHLPWDEEKHPYKGKHDKEIDNENEC